MINHWNNATPLQPHTHAMKDKAKELWTEAFRMSDRNEDSGEYIYQPADILALIVLAADLERYALQPVEFALPPGECACKLPEESCIYCQPHAEKLELI